MAYILPFFVAEKGNLWRFSSAKLESRGGRVKRIARAVVCWQARGVYKRTIAKRRMPGAGPKTVLCRTSKSGVKSVLDRLIFQEQMGRDGTIRIKQAKRFRETGRLKKTREAPKMRRFEADRLTLRLSCESAFEAMYRGHMPRIYDDQGRLNSDYSGVQFDVSQ